SSISEPDLQLEGSYVGGGSQYFDEEKRRHHEIKNTGSNCMAQWNMNTLNFRRSSVGQFHSGAAMLFDGCTTLLSQ
ncbi:hypothetical protein L9F63_027446, partial [Diploptera punctata]